MLRQQINVLRRTAPKRLLISSMDRLILVGLYRLFPDVRGALTIIKPDTVLSWHRAGFRAYWRWKSRTRGERPKLPSARRLTSFFSEFAILNASSAAQFAQHANDLLNIRWPVFLLVRQQDGLSQMRAEVADERCLLHRRDTNIPDGRLAARSRKLNPNDRLWLTDKLERHHVTPRCEPLLLKT
ncbi:MAG TPA: hypothetical protein VEK84_10935 [Terriglobales bacterium]|nr:hypothetical protein [Terriglobales bacterium]